MSKDIEPKIRVEDIEHVGKIELGEWGLEVKEALTTKDWLDAVLSLQKFDGKMQWYLGDLVVYAQSDLVGWDSKTKDGSKNKYEKLIEATGYDYHTLANMANVARRFPSSFREQFFNYVIKNSSNSHLSWNHFYAAASIKDDTFAAYWLQKAADNGWGVKKLREEIYDWKLSRGEIVEKDDKPIGFESFDKFKKEFFNGFVPRLSHSEYDKKTWLLEMRDVVDEALKEFGVINAI